LKPEEQLHRACVQLLWVYEAFGRLTFAHCPNGERRDAATGGRLKAMGVRAGVPDLLIWPNGGNHFGVELKAGKGGLSPSQVIWHSTLASMGHRVYIVRTVGELEEALRTEGIPAIGRVSA